MSKIPVNVMLEIQKFSNVYILSNFQTMSWWLCRQIKRNEFTEDWMKRYQRIISCSKGKKFKITKEQQVRLVKDIVIFQDQLIKDEVNYED